MLSPDPKPSHQERDHRTLPSRPSSSRQLEADNNRLSVPDANQSPKKSNSAVTEKSDFSRVTRTSHGGGTTTAVSGRQSKESRYSGKYSVSSSLVERILTFGKGKNVPLEIRKVVEFWYLVRSDRRLLVAMFTARWCGACKKVMPQVHEMVKEFRSIVVCTVDVDHLDTLADEMDVRSMPTFVFYKDGRKVDVVKGTDVEGVRRVIEKHMDQVTPTKSLTLTTSKVDLKEIVQRERGLVVVYFADSESSACKKMSVKMEELAGNYPDVVMIQEDINRNREAAVKFGVTEVPVTFFFKGGALEKIVHGPKDGKVKDAIEKYRKFDLKKSAGGEMLVLKNSEDLSRVTSENRGKLVVVYFFASYSESVCKDVESKLDKMAAKSRDGLVMCKFDIDDDQKTTDRLGITRLPTFHLYRGDSKVHQVVGAKVDELKHAIKHYTRNSL